MLKKVSSVSLIFLLMILTSCGGNTYQADQKLPEPIENADSSEDPDTETDSNTIFDSQLQQFIMSLETEGVELYVIEEKENIIDYKSDSIKRVDKGQFLDFANRLCELSYIPLENPHSFYEAERQYTIFSQMDNKTVQAITVAGNFAFLDVSNNHENGSSSYFGSQTEELSGINESFKMLLEQSTSMNILTAEEIMRKNCDADDYDFTFRDGTIYAVKVSEDDTRRYRLTVDCASAGGVLGYRPCYSIATTLDVYDIQTNELIESEGKFAGILEFSMFDGRLV